MWQLLKKAFKTHSSPHGRDSRSQGDRDLSSPRHRGAIACGDDKMHDAIRGDRRLTRTDVSAAYRFILGRDPSDEIAYNNALALGSAERLRHWLMGSFEFALTLRREQPHVLRRWMLDEMQARTAASAVGRPRIVFLHIMKTAGSTIRHRLEEVAQGPVWRREIDGPPGNASPDNLSPYHIVMGHFTMTDALHVPPPRRIFTILRDPQERIVSLYHFLARHRAEVAARPGFELAAIARRSTLEQFLVHQDERVKDATYNVMTRVLAGDFVPSASRGRYAPPGRHRETISGPALLSRALHNLFSLDVFTLVDRLDIDQPRIMAELGLPDLGPLPFENTRETVNDLLEPRDPPIITPVAERLLRRCTDLDRLLYRLAREHLG